ncbi:MAG TPA: tetratricopeptide repeat protein [Planctomycetota bacterium]|jgi:tetratricopeptide (TPR) repeat protein|nr:tetratricopeptide repeat protein [Planctomycetota bacterium]
MIPVLPLSLAAALAASLGSASGSSLDRRDVIVTSDGRRLAVDEVLADALPEVRYRLQGSERTIPASAVLRIEYRDEPPALRQAREKRDPQASHRALAIAREAKGVRPWLAEAVDFESAGVLEAWGAAEPGRTEEAAAAYRAFAETYPSSRRFPAALLGRARCLETLLRFDDALALFDELGPRLETLGEEAGLELSFERAQVLLAAGRAPEAREALRALEGRIARLPLGSPPSLLARVRVAEGDGLLAEGSSAEALAHYRRLLAEADGDFELRAAARAGEGEALLGVGKVREAMFALAEARAIDPAGGPATARATYLLAECHRRLVGREPDAERRARSYFLEVVNRHSSTPWAGRARAALGG